MLSNSTVKSEAAVIVGFNRLGGVARLTSLLHDRGYQRLVAIVNAPEQLSDLQNTPGLSFTKIDDPLSSESMLSVVKTIEGYEPASPFICIQDRPMFAYLDAFEATKKDISGVPWVPVDGIRNARMKPRARKLWDDAKLAGPAWTVVTGDEDSDRIWSEKTCIPKGSDVKYIVKPIQGMASEYVCSAQGWSAAVERANSIRAQLESSNLPKHRQLPITLGDSTFFPSRDILIEEELLGPEYTVDGFIQSGRVHAVVQHKETKRRHPFFGDGLIVSPPDEQGLTAVVQEGYESQSHRGPSEAAFIKVVRDGLVALGIDNWSFHAEMIVTDAIPRFVELNPRPAGGLLWQTAGIRLGVDPIEATVDLHLRKKIENQCFSCVTGQFPLYAEKLGTISKLIGRDVACGISGVHDVRSAIPADGLHVTSLDRENYLAFVSLNCRDHEHVRAVSYEVQQILRAR